METFGERVKRGRLAKGWNRREADRITGISADTWKNIELRGTDPQLSTVQRIVEALGIPAEELIAAPVRRKEPALSGRK